ncbi:hypothetical protein LXA43DRAFT_1098557 [Ganoderma leucocontextum]|nr:hypothetical protein LXA43DRAFT_1098557 [Ganoderma leucocontextum]
MATIDSLHPHVYFLLETRSKNFDSSDDVRSVTLFILLPTAEITLALIREHELLQWIELAEGDTLGACELPAQQRSSILTLLYAYRACYYQIGVTSSEISVFFRLLVEAAMSLDEHEPADVVLEDLAGYVHDIFPTIALASPEKPQQDASVAVTLPIENSESSVPRGTPVPASVVAGMCILPARSSTVRARPSPANEPPSPTVAHPPTTPANAAPADLPAPTDGAPVATQVAPMDGAPHSTNIPPAPAAFVRVPAELAPVLAVDIPAPTNLSPAPVGDVPAPTNLAPVPTNLAPAHVTPAATNVTSALAGVAPAPRDVVAPPSLSVALPSPGDVASAAAEPVHAIPAPALLNSTPIRSTSVTVERTIGSGRRPRPVAVSEDEDDGGMSDDLCPSLRSVADSSDEEGEDGLEALRIITFMAFLHAELEEYVASRRAQ